MHGLWKQFGLFLNNCMKKVLFIVVLKYKERKNISNKKVFVRKVMPYSMGCCTPLSNFEAGQNYNDTYEPAVWVSFPLALDPTVRLVT
jgi:isoleucyl-tRNA synthetase